MNKFNMPALPYAEDALAPVISAETIKFHYGKHLQTYVDNLNALLPGSGLEDAPLEEIVVRAQGGLFNNAGQTLNHTMYFLQLRAPREDNKPTGAIAKAIDAAFGSFEAFKEEFQKKTVGLFGSGWAWLAADAEGHLCITQEGNAGNPIVKGLRPLLTVDVWEHAYYLDYQNRRAAYAGAFWSIIDWDVINERLTK